MLEESDKRQKLLSPGLLLVGGVGQSPRVGLASSSSYFSLHYALLHCLANLTSVRSSSMTLTFVGKSCGWTYYNGP
jgi:hypothetical protein